MMLCSLVLAALTLAPEVRNLPVTEVVAKAPSDRIAVLLTGDGGWSGPLDRGLAAQLAERGISTVGFDCLRYFWHQRSPQQTADDLARVLRYYLSAWHAQHVVLIGYSFGADALPFVVKRLPPELREHVETLNLLGPSESASFEIHLAGFIPGVKSRGEAPVAPELLSLDVPTLCLYGEGDREALCPTLPADRVTTDRIGSGHHFSADYTALADRILRFARSLD
jgi:type IV secretory pathway VirJ component